jgi:hypothetical protein
MLKEQERKRNRRFRRKEKKKFIQGVKKVTETKPIFDKNIPLIDQIKSQLSEEEFNKICQQKQQIEEFDAPKPKKDNNFMIKREKNTNQNAILEVDLNAQQKENEEGLGKTAPTEEDKLRKLFPKAEKISEMYETFDEYEENLDILDLMEKNREEDHKSQEEDIEEEQVKYKELEENIVIHEYE